MKDVFGYITRRCETFNAKPLFVYLRDERIPPRQRLRFVPHVAHFVMTFADLYHFFLTETATGDRYQELVNTHLAEEGNHWKWFLSDLTALDLDPTIPFTDALRFLWGDGTVKTRSLAYQMCKLSGGLSSLHKLVMVLAIEATGRVALEAAVPAGREVQVKSGRRLVYFGQHHLDTERQHTVEDGAVHQALESTELSSSIRSELYAIVDEVFHHFGEFVDETFELVKTGAGFGPAAEADEQHSHQLGA
jgi:hypothetical protein